ncbi:MAG: sulfite exporter TauE/SafE family protein [Steroidobacteraceae bacterium]
MSEVVVWALPLALFFGAVLYTSVGHAGASAYIAIMTVFGLSPAVIKPTALMLNVLVAAFISVRFIRNGYFDRRLALWVVVGAIPASFIGGYLQLPDTWYKPLVGLILLFAAARLIMTGRTVEYDETQPPRGPVASLAGAGIGLISGLTGTGGGIFLSPLVVLRRWTTIRKTSGTAAVFILCNSLSGLLGNYAAVQSLPPLMPVYGIAVLAGAVVGTTLGLRRFDNRGLRICLGLVLVIAAGKFLFD